MTSPTDTPEAYYIAYIDEAGDPGLNRVKPNFAGGASEWLVLGAAVIPVAKEPEVVGWVREARHAVKSRQGPDLHFRVLSDDRKITRLLKFLPRANGHERKFHSPEYAAYQFEIGTTFALLFPKAKSETRQIGDSKKVV